jgi:hypothetical protein
VPPTVLSSVRTISCGAALFLSVALSVLTPLVVPTNTLFLSVALSVLTPLVVSTNTLFLSVALSVLTPLVVSSNVPHSKLK